MRFIVSVLILFVCGCASVKDNYVLSGSVVTNSTSNISDAATTYISSLTLKNCAVRARYVDNQFHIKFGNRHITATGYSIHHLNNGNCELTLQNGQNKNS
ncbi:hypothetical protein HII17_04245 [Thalassotalea sp. M1531]|uniref:Lipoprotein n=1 Tax=Thalassotalea algicola TaxID=2716224 RepID=A0A7Y0LA45_9GAMM|nr:hypothetical protein [Thalassotalea algicola]NMP30765.1 hypothetical protein [Thalassotalea algicola]